MPKLDSNPGSRGERGITLAEMLVVMLISVTVILVALSMIEEAMTLSAFAESHNDLTVLSQRPVNAIQKELLQSAWVGDSSGNGNAYATSIQGQLGTYTAASDSILPAINNTTGATLAPDGATQYTGNSLLIARKLPPLLINVPQDPVNSAGFPAITYFADNYRFEYFFLSRNTSRPFSSGTYSLDLIRFRSIPFADFFQLTNDVATLSPTQLQYVSARLRGTTANTASSCTPASACTGPNALPYFCATAWNLGQDLNNSFYTIDANLAFPGGSGPIATPTITRLDVGSMMPEIFKGRITAKMLYTIGYFTNASTAATLRGVPTRVPLTRYFNTASTNTNLPADAGFEVQVAGGQSGFQQILTRLVLYSNYRVSQFDSQEGFVITSF
jgi:Tfp pilus assembly protein FimT